MTTPKLLKDSDFEQLKLEEEEVNELLLRVARKRRIRENEGALEYASRLFACGDLIEDAASKAGVTERQLRDFLHSTQGLETVKNVREELDEEFKNLYSEATDVMRQGMRHPKVEVRLASAGLFMRHAKELKIVVDVTAEDLVQRIMQGSLKTENENL